MTQVKRFTLRELPLAARLVLAAFLIAVGIGYGSALIQLHFQHATAGQGLPSVDDVVRRFHGESDPAKRVSMLQRLIETPAGEGVPFNSAGTMVPAFTTRSNGYTAEIRKRPKADVDRERENERLALLAFIKSGLKRDQFDADKMPRPESLDNHPLTAEFVHADDSIKIKSLFNERCVRCHVAGGDDEAAAKYPIDTFERIQSYGKVDENAGAMSLPALTQSTHAHLLAFAVLWCVTGLVIAFSSYPAWIRNTLAPVVLVAQVADIACWWLARLEGDVGVMFAGAIIATGGIVGVGVALQIVLGLFDLFGKSGRAVLVILALAAGYGTYVIKNRAIDPHLQREREAKSAAKEA